MEVQKYINKRSASAKERPTAIGLSTKSFAPGGLDGYIGKIAKEALDRQDRRAEQKARTLNTYYSCMIASFYKRGIVTYLGNSRRQIQAAEICKKMKIISENKEIITKSQFGVFVHLCRKYGSATQCKKSGPNIVSWSLITKINQMIRDIEKFNNNCVDNHKNH